MQFSIKRTIENVPGGMMVVPLLVGALIATFFPDTSKFFGSFTGAGQNRPDDKEASADTLTRRMVPTARTAGG